MCITIAGGVPIFNRKYGDIKSVRLTFLKLFKFPNVFILQLPYPLMASLNGIAMFAQSHDVTVLTAQSKDSKLMWRDYHDSLRLIIALPLDTLSDVHIYR